MQVNRPEFRVIFWNVWSECQLTGRIDALCNRLGRLIDEYQPDVFGLNEVVVNRTTGASAILAFLASQGYETHFTAQGPEVPGFVIGCALASRRTPSRIGEPVLGPDNGAARRGFDGYTIRAIDADIPVEGGEDVRVIVNHWAHLIPQNWWAHWQHARGLSRHLEANPGPSRVVIGGDFNELKSMPAIRSLSRSYNRATGTFRQPTWRWAGQRRRLLRANYDNVLWSRDGLNLHAFSVLPSMPSDHAPLLAHFRLPLLTRGKV
ncbi:MAG TPA: endonuclease/exonuclease/phosphatase family protein [Candidatus Saccharimonadia bacterium]|jgi:endonuclease/exonuclease/phosphatase (EEP) superfamily protein YafD|nr:endonuclease/exonuclease/phosphatase family protein [Candidatus Saccharimonadia bacterium]